MAEKKFLDDQARLDRLAEADVIGKQQVRSGARQGSLEWSQLVGLDVGAAAERRLDRSVIGAGDRTPAQRIDEGRESVRVVELVGVDLLGEAPVRQRTPALLEFPH